MPLIGTAGHVDHGKSSLVERLTGRDPDRWAEEKARGLTIDLGFAWATFPSGTEVSFVDVPGHEKFLKNMLAGVDNVDVALFVVAADEGWMPQSEEHLAVLDLLGVDTGVVAVSKVDIVDPELAELATLETSERLAGTSLSNAPIIGVSPVTGEGIEELVGQLDRMSAAIEPGDAGRPRLWIDRAFAIQGAGTVVTGTLQGGSLKVDDEIEIMPGGANARVRGIHSHERTRERVEPGRRVALNLAGVSPDEIDRGSMVGLPGQWELSDRFTVRLSSARYADPLDRRGAYQLHLGTSAHGMRVLGIEGEHAVVQIDALAPLAAGDRFVVRDTGRRLVTAGGVVLDPEPGRTTEALTTARTIDTANPNDLADRLLELRGAESAGRLAAHTSGGSPSVGCLVGEQWVSEAELDTVTSRVLTMVDQHHRDHPLRDGPPLATLAERLGVAPEIVEEVVEGTAELERKGPSVRQAGRRVELGADAEESWQRTRSVLEEGLDVPSVPELPAQSEVLHLKVREGELVQVSESLVYLSAQAEEIENLILGLGDGFTVSQFRDAAGLSRKYAVPILEWADRTGITVRDGDTRKVIRRREGPVSRSR